MHFTPCIWNMKFQVHVASKSWTLAQKDIHYVAFLRACIHVAWLSSHKLCINSNANTCQTFSSMAAWNELNVYTTYAPSGLVGREMMANNNGLLYAKCFNDIKSRTKQEMYPCTWYGHMTYCVFDALKHRSPLNICQFLCAKVAHTVRKEAYITLVLSLNTGETWQLFNQYASVFNSVVYSKYLNLYSSVVYQKNMLKFPHVS